MKKLAIPLIVFVALIGGGVAASIWKKGQAASNVPYPPRGAQFLDPSTSPDVLMALGNSRKKNKPDPLAEYQGLWIGEPGWEGTVQIVADEAAGPTLRWEQSASGMFGASSYWMIVVLKDSDSRVKVGSKVRVMGMFEDANSITSVNSPLPQYRVILKNAKVLEIK